MEFGSGYYAQSDEDAHWRDEGEVLSRRLIALLHHVVPQARAAVERALSTSKIVHARLRSITQLGKGSTLSIPIVVSDEPPPPVIELLKDVPDDLLWVLLNQPRLRMAQRALHDTAERMDGLKRLAGPTASDALTELSFLRTAEAIDEILAATENWCRDIRKRLLVSRKNTFGAYHFGGGKPHITLYWFGHWIAAQELGVEIEDLAIGTLVHELAHHYHHRGPDADGLVWQTQDFYRADERICEGLAEFHTEIVVQDLDGPRGNGPFEAFRKLQDRLGPEYTCYRDWVASDGRRAEVIREALIAARSEPIYDYQEFLRAVRAAEDRLGPHGRRSVRRANRD